MSVFKFMTIQINYKTSYSKKVSSNLVLFVDEKFNISGLKKHISNSEFSYIADLLSNAKKSTSCDLFAAERFRI